MIRSLFYFKAGMLLILAVLILSACNGEAAPEATSAGAQETAPASPSSEIAPSPSPAPPSATPVALAARVNGYEISLAEYQAELALFEQAAGRPPEAEDQKLVMDDLIGQALLAQAAESQGFMVDQALLQERTLALEKQLGSAEALDGWMQAHGYSPETFQAALGRQIAAAWMRDQIVAGVPKTAEQVHVRQILHYNLEDANAALTRLQGGESFESLAAETDPFNQGDLGWFPRGYLPDARLEEAAFSLEAGQVSNVIETLAGYHIIQVLERDPQYVLDPQALLAVQIHAVQEWVLQQMGESQIEILLP
jgi:parvulin-like peptidyl-prolyl isomerase